MILAVNLQERFSVAVNPVSASGLLLLMQRRKFLTRPLEVEESTTKSFEIQP